MLSIWARVDLGAMAIKLYSAFPKAPAVLESNHEIVKCHIHNTHLGNEVLPFCKGAVSIFYSPSQLDNIRLICLWACGTYSQNLSTKLHGLIKFTVDVYAIYWFEIKKKDNFHNQQLYIFNMIQRIGKQSPEIQKIPLKNTI